MQIVEVYIASLGTRLVYCLVSSRPTQKVGLENEFLTGWRPRVAGISLASQCKEYMYDRQISRGGGLGLGLEQCVQMHSQCVVHIS